jgi:endothelin-converting enzyme
LNEDLIKSRGTRPLNDVLDETFKKFAHEDLSSTILFALQSGMNSLISAGTGADDKDPDTVVVSVSAPWSIGLPAKEMYKDDKIIKQYESTISKVFSNLGLDVLGSTELAEKLVTFEKMLAAATPSAEDRNDVTVSKSSSKA